MKLIQILLAIYLLIQPNRSTQLPETRHPKQLHFSTSSHEDFSDNFNNTTPASFKAFSSRVLSPKDNYELFSNHQWNILSLGSPLEPFKGPRKRRDSSYSNKPADSANIASVIESLHLTPQRGRPFIDKSYYNSQYKMKADPEWSSVVNHQVTQMLSPQLSRRETTLTQEEFHYRQQSLQNALRAAWDQYGPKTHGPAIDPVVYTNHVYPTAKAEEQYPGYESMSHGNFQDMKSEWDSHVTLVPNPNPVVLEPGFFSRFLSSYIDFEVNNHEVADLVRKVVFGIFVGVLAVGWIALGFFLGMIPLKLLGKGIKMSSGKILDFKDSKNELTERILLSLDSDWLKQLEEKVFKTDTDWIKTHVRCCVLPEEEANGVADCTLVRKGRNMDTFECLTDLIYNFEFSPKDQDAVHEKSNHSF